MAGAPRDWDKEMAAIDQVIAKGGYVAPSGAGAPSPADGGGTAPVAPAAPGGRRAWLGMWIRTLLVMGLAAGLNAWPWSHACGWRVYGYLGGVAILAVGSLWVMFVSWRRRSGLSHLLGLLTLAYAVWLGAAEILPRVGYAKTTATWSCAAPSPAPAAASPAPAAGSASPSASSQQGAAPAVQP